MALPRCVALACLAFALPPLGAQRPQLAEATRDELHQRIGGDPLRALAEVVAPGHGDRPAWLTADLAAGPAFAELLRCGLWNDDPQIAYGAASLLREGALDIAAIDRWLEVVRPHVFDAEPHWDWDTFKHVVSADDVAALLVDPPSFGAEIRFHFINDLHRSLRPEHMPALLELTRHADPFVRKQARQQLGVLSVYTDQHRDVVARALLEWPGPGSDEVDDQDDRSRMPRYVPRPYTLPPPRPGWSPLLRAALQRAFLESEGKEAPFAACLMRWAEAEQPAGEDRLLLRALLDSPRVEGTWIALRGICRVGADAWLRRVLQEEPEAVSRPLVLAARGELEALRELAAEDAEALAVALEFDFDGVWLPWVAAAFGADEAAGLQAIDLLAEADEPAPAPYRRCARLPSRLRQAIACFGKQLGFARLHRLVVGFPEARSRTLVDLYWAALRPHDLPEAHVAVFEPDFPLRERLRVWAHLPEPECNAAKDLLLRLGDGELGGEIVEYWQLHHAGDPLLLARCRDSTAVREFLDRHLAEAALPAGGTPEEEWSAPLAAAAAAHGLPSPVAASWAETLVRDVDPERVRQGYDGWRRQVLDGDPVAAVLASLDGPPGRELWFRDLGLVEDERVRDHLLRLRQQPRGDLQGVIGELALAGDHRSRLELGTMRARRLYGWFDNASANVRTLGRSLDLMPYLIGECETICCRRNGAGWAIEELTGFDVHGQPERALCTQHDHLLRWWQKVGDRLCWSEIEQRHVVAPD